MSADDPRRIEAKRLALEKGWTQAKIASHFSVTTRTVERWAQKDGWGALKQAQNVVSISEARKPSPSPSTPRNPPSIRQSTADSIDEIQVVEGAIASLYTMITGINDRGDDIPVDTRGIGGIAGALVRFLEYRRKIKPPTAAELAEQVIAMGISPAEFVSELKQQWQQRA
jgi:hypothetical protein